MDFPIPSIVTKLQPNMSRLFIGAYGFEDRSLGWTKYQKGNGPILNNAIVFRYKYPKGKNRIKDLKEDLVELGSKSTKDVRYNAQFPYNFEETIFEQFEPYLSNVDEIILDITALTKLLILVSLFQLTKFKGTLRIVYSEAEHYSPTQQEYENSKEDQGLMTKFPSRGFESIVRTKCLSSIRMQGQPVALVAFTSFNEQLIRHILGTINPHRLLFINGRPPREDYVWREFATQEIHKNLIEEYLIDNPINGNERLARVASTLDYRETIYQIDQIYKQVGTYERIICAATGSKMQTVGLFFSKIQHPDIHIEYPTPNSYFGRGLSKGVLKVYETVIPHFSDFLKSVGTISLPSTHFRI